MRALQLITTVESHDVATRIAAQLVERGVAACVQIEGPIESHYVWEGKPTISREFRLVAKILVEKQAAAETLIRQLHPYTIPELITLPLASVSPDYLEWMESHSIKT